VKLNNNRWAVIMGNGYNSTNEAPVLLIQYLDGQRELLKVSPCRLPIASSACSFKGTNGLSAPATVDANADGKIDVVYAGDLQGQVWRFDLNSANDQEWHAAFDGQPLFVAKGTDGGRLSITAAPYWLPHPNGGIMLTVGTGVALTDADRTSTRVNVILGLHDNSKFQSTLTSVSVTDGEVINTATGNGMPSSLVQQTMVGQVHFSGKNYFTGSQNPVNYTGANPHRGWYLAMPNTGQRLLSNPYQWTGNLVTVPTVIPSAGSTELDACTISTSPEVSFPFVLNTFSGRPSSKPIVSIPDTTLASNIIGYQSGTREHVFRSRDSVITANPDGKGVDKFALPKSMGQRLSWREIP
jgi:type IV pilus assembly protein PilY1